MQKSPFKFLDSYSKEDRNIFFGRDKEIEELYSRVFTSRILVVYGVSGTGKSSLINCGLANKFNDADWLPVSVRRGLNINRSLYDNLARNVLTATGKKNDTCKLLRSVYLDHFKPIFLIFDQFEEVFIFGTKDERTEFIETVSRILNTDLQCRFIFSIREEYLAGFTEFEKTIPAILDNRIRIEKMTRQNATRAISGPCEINSINVEEGFPEKLLDKLNPETPDVELTYLQVFLDKIFRIASSLDEDHLRMSNSLVDDAGDVKDILGSFLEEQISNLDDPDKGLVILKSFVSLRGTKHQITEEEVIEYSRTLGSEMDGATVTGFIQKFIKLRILRDKDEHGRYELRHDSLASCIYEKITLVEKELLEIRQFIENSYRNFEKRKLYLTADDLAYIAPYEDKLFLNEKLEKFIENSKWELHRVKRRRQNALIIFGATLIAVLTFFTVWALRERINALEQKSFAEVQKDEALKAKNLADSSMNQAVISKNLAIENEKIAVEARRQSDAARQDALREREYALQQKSLAEKLSVTATEQARIANEQKLRAEEERVKAVAAEKEAKRLAALSGAQTSALTALNNERSPWYMSVLATRAYKNHVANGGKMPDPLIYEALSRAWLAIDSTKSSVYSNLVSEAWSITADGNDILAADIDGRIMRFDNSGKITGMQTLKSSSAIDFIKLSPGGNCVITQDDNNNIICWIKTPGSKEFISHPLTGYSKPLSSADFDRNGEILATSGQDSIIRVWDLRNDHPVSVRSYKYDAAVPVVSCWNADTLFFADITGSVNMLNITRGTIGPVYKAEYKKPLSLQYNKKNLFTGYVDGQVRVSYYHEGSWPGMLQTEHSAGVELIAVSPDFSLLATACRDKSIKLYYYEDYFVKKEIRAGVIILENLPGRVRSITFTKDNRLVAGLSDRTIHIWESSPAVLAEKISGAIKDSVITINTGF